jgi:hypothetical protein
MSVFNKLRDDADPWDGDPKPMEHAPAVPVRRFPGPESRQRVYTPEELYFGVLDTPQGLCVVMVPIWYWNAHRADYPDHIRLQRGPAFLLDEPDMECSWVVPDDAAMDANHVRDLVAGWGYQFNRQFEDFHVAQANGLRHQAFVEDDEGD